MSMIDVSNLTFGYEGSPELIFDHVGFQIDSGWKLGFTGRNGRGKTTFLRLLQGEYPYSGTISASVEFEYFPYEVANLSRTGLEVVREIAPEAEDWEIQRELGLLDLAERSLELPFSSLSNGERTKVLLAAMFLKENAFLLIDEPTNHLDLEGRRKLGSYLARKRGFLLVSHDRAFLDQCVDHILAINRTNIEIQRGNFSSWWENRRRQDAFELARQEKLQKDIGRLTESARRASGWSDRTEKSKFGVEGKQAIIYCRLREVDDDFHRMNRQNEVILKIVEKLSKKNLIELMDIVNEMLPYVETNLTNNEIKNYVSSLLSFDLKHLDQFQIPSKGMDSIEKVIEYNGFSPIYMMENYEELAKELHWNIYEDEDYQPSSTIVQLEQNIQREFGS